MLELYHGLSVCAQKAINAGGKRIGMGQTTVWRHGDQLQGSYHWFNVSKNIIDTTTRRVDLNA